MKHFKTVHGDIIDLSAFQRISLVNTEDPDKLPRIVAYEKVGYKNSHMIFEGPMNECKKCMEDIYKLLGL